jgi:trimeric autotransporter adhesin
MKKFVINILIILGCPTLFGQSWIEVPQIQLNAYSHCLYTDTIDNLLYFGGLFGLNGTDSVRGVATWDNSTISGCGEGINSFYQSFQSGVPLSEIVRFQDKIYVGGGATQFTVGDSIWTRGIGVWDGVAWDSVNVPLMNDFGNPTGVLEMKAIGDILYVGGGFTNINGITEANGLAKFDGTTWSTVHDFPEWGGTSVNVVRHIEEFNGEIYVAGQLTDSYPYDTMYNICKFNGSEWVQLGDGIGGGFSEILGMEVFQGKALCMRFFQ